MFDNGPGKVLVEYVPTNSSELCDNGWHVVVADKDGATGTLTIDHTTTITQTSPFQQFYAVNTDDPLYVGGVPGKGALTLQRRKGCYGWLVIVPPCAIQWLPIRYRHQIFKKKEEKLQLDEYTVDIIIFPADTVRLRYTVMSGAFDGCLANPQLTAGDDGEMQTLLLAQSSESGGVTFHTCQG